MKSRTLPRPWVLLFLGLSLTGILAWAGISLIGKGDASVIPLDTNAEQVLAPGQQDPLPGEVVQAKGLGNLELDREGARDLDVVVQVLQRLEQGDGDLDPGRVLLRMQSVRVGKPMPFAWRIDAGPDAGRHDESRGEELLRDLRPGWYLLTLSGPGGAKAPRLLQLHAGTETTLRVDWTHTGRARGRIFDPRGEAVAGAHVQIGGVEARTDTEGRFELEGLWPGTGLPLLIEADQWASRVEPIGVVASSQPPQELRFVLEEAAEVEGIVAIPRQEWKDARIFVLPGRPSGRNRSGRGYAHLPLFWKGRFSDVRLDASGRFRIRGLSRAVPLALGLVHPRYRLESPYPLLISKRAGKPREEVVLRPERMRILSGKVTAEDGKPVQARLEMRGEGRWGSAYFRGGPRPPLPGEAAAMGSSVTASDASGHYSMGVPARGSTIEVQAPGFAVLQRPAPGTETADLELAKGHGSPAAGAFLLRLQFEREVTQAGKLRALRLHLRRVGSEEGSQSSKGPVLVDPRQPFELPIEAPSRVRITVREKGSSKPLFEEVLDLRGARTLTIQ